jgi:hypothetical protein
VDLDSLVALADGVLVLVGLSVAEEPPVGLGPIEGVMVEVAGSVGVNVDVDVEVAAGVSVNVLVGVFVTGGESTVKEPLFNLTAIPLPLGSVAAALLSVRGEVPGTAPTSTLKITLATGPSGIAS